MKYEYQPYSLGFDLPKEVSIEEAAATLEALSKLPPLKEDESNG